MSGQDMAEGGIDLGDGVIIDDKFRLGAMVWLEERTGKGVLEWVQILTSDEEKLAFQDVMLLLVALLIQREPDITEEEARKRLRRVDLERASEIIGTALTFEAKNSPSSPEQQTEPAAEN